MANISVDWEVDGIITPEDSVSAMMKVLATKTIEHTGTFWTWEGRVCHTEPKVHKKKGFLLIIA
jgi:hypothetical protein